MLKRRRGEVQEPDIEFGPDGRPTARSWAAIERAARAGDVVSMANFGLGLYERGERSEGLRRLEKAWRSGNASAGFNLGTIYFSQGDTNRAEVVWQKAADLGDPHAMQYAAEVLAAGGRTGEAAQLRARAQAVWQATGENDTAFR